MNTEQQTSSITQDFSRHVDSAFTSSARECFDHQKQQPHTTVTPDKQEASSTANFITTNQGVFYTGDNEKLWICSRLEVRALVRDSLSENWGRLLVFYDNDGKKHKWSMPMEMLKGGGDDLRGELLRQGLVISPSSKARHKLTEYIITSQPTSRVKCVTQTGWHGNIFVFPHKTFGLSDEILIYQAEQTQNYYHERETLQEWRMKIAKYCMGNSRLVFAVSAAFATSYGVTGWEKGESQRAAKICFQSWLEQRGGEQNSERNAMLAQVRGFFEAHGSSRFELIGSPNQQITNRVGFKKIEQDKTWFYVLPEAFRQEICIGLDIRTVSKQLIEEKWLLPDSDGKSTRPERLPGMPRTRCYVFTPKLWENV